MLRSGLRVLMVLGCMLGLIGAPPIQAQGPFAGKRAIFDEGIGWTTKAGALYTLGRIKAAGFNVYVPCVWHGRGTSWPSQHAPWDFQLNDRPKDGYDPLKFLIEKAHAMGIEVHPWFTVALRQSDLFPELAEEGTPKDAFDVHNERFVSLMADLVGEVVRGYDVDGVNLDYVRTMGVCVSASCKQAYSQRYGRDLVIDKVLSKLRPGLAPTLGEFQETAVTALVRAISERVRATKPQMRISVDAAPDVLSVEQGQNSVDWINKGLVQVIFRMDYGRSIDLPLTEAVRGRLTNPDALTLLISDTEEVNGRIVPRDGPWLTQTVSLVQSRWPGTGIGIYLYNMLTNEDVTLLRQGPFMDQTGGTR